MSHHHLQTKPFTAHFTNFNQKLFQLTALVCVLALSCASATAQKKRRTLVGVGGSRAVVIDERLAAMREEPDLTARLVQRLSRGRTVALIGSRRAPDGLMFYRVATTRRTRGWVQSEALASVAHPGDDERLLNLIRASDDFERIARARIFLDTFTRSPLRPAVLLLYGEAAEDVASKLSRDANRRLNEEATSSAPAFSYYLNFNELDRYNRQGVTFVFDRAAKQYYYDGASWRELVRRHPRSPEAEQARARLNAPAKVANGKPGAR